MWLIKVLKGRAPQEKGCDIMPKNEFFAQFNRSVAAMEGREKGTLNDLCGDNVYHIVTFDFLEGEEGQFAVFAIAEDDKNFYFGNHIITDMLLKVREANMDTELSHEGIKFLERMSKKGRTYTSFEFVQ